MSIDLLLVNAEEIVTPQASAACGGARMDRLSVHPSAALAVHAGRVLEIGPSADLHRRYSAIQEVDARGCFVLPGFVDAHTHPVFAKTREREADLRVRGVGYEEITRQGGGIFRSVDDLRAATDADLGARVRAHLDGFLARGTTTIEAKSGYGLCFEHELRSLEILAAVGRDHPVKVEPTFLGAHQMPREFAGRRGAYVDELCGSMIPEVVRRSLARYCDVFCDVGAFDVKESRRVLETGRDYGLKLRVHAEELGPSGGAELACSLGAVTADHLVHVTDSTIDRMLEVGVQPVLLPGTVFSLGLKQAPPARRMIERGHAVVLATDFNPGTSYLQSTPFLIALAVQVLRMTVAECIHATTINAAASLGLAADRGALLAGMRADAVLIKGHSHLLLGYRLGEDPVRGVVADGRYHPAQRL